jgi:hypothetical protein
MDSQNEDFSRPDQPMSLMRSSLLKPAPILILGTRILGERFSARQ